MFNTYVLNKEKAINHNYCLGFNFFLYKNGFLFSDTLAFEKTFPQSEHGVENIDEREKLLNKP